MHSFTSTLNLIHTPFGRSTISTRLSTAAQCPTRSNCANSAAESSRMSFKNHWREGLIHSIALGLGLLVAADSWL